MTTTLTSTGLAVDGGSLQINGSSQIYTPNYGWLHDYFTRTVNAGNGLTGGGSGANLTISHPAYTAMTLGRTTHTVLRGSDRIPDRLHAVLHRRRIQGRPQGPVWSRAWRARNQAKTRH